MPRPSSTPALVSRSALCALAVALAAPAVATQPDRDHHRPQRQTITAESLVRVRLIADVAEIAPGRTFHLAAVFDIDDHWHIYWQNPGDAGAPTTITLDPPEGFTVAAPLFPRPQAFVEEIATTYGYEKQAVIFIPVTAPQQLTTGLATFHARISYFVCRDRCLMGRVDTSLQLPALSDPTQAPDSPNPADARLLQSFRRRLPRPFARLPGADATFDGRRLTVTGPATDFHAVEFFPLDSPALRYTDITTQVRNGRFRIESDIEIRRQNARGRPISIKGLVGLGKSPADPCYHFDLPLESP